MNQLAHPRSAGLLALVGLVALAVLVSTASAGERRVAHRHASNSALIVNLWFAPTTLDPTTTNSNYESGLLGNIYGTLTHLGTKPGPGGTTRADLGTSHVVPYLAKSWTVSKDGKTYTVKLRPGMKFPSGDPVDANAVKFSFERIFKMNQSGASVLLETQFKPRLIQSVSVKDPLTAIIKYARRDPNAPQAWASPTGGAIFDPAVVNAHGGVKANKINTWLASHVAGYGPFLLKSYEPNHQMVLVANPNFFEQPASKQIVVNFVQSDPTLLLQARSGTADVTLGLSNQAIHSLQGNPCCRIIATPSSFTEYLNLPQTPKIPVLKNVKFRAALSYAVPYQAILEKIAFGYGKLYYGEWMPAFPWFNPKYGAPRPYDLNKAKQLLAQSGVKTPIKFPILVPEGSTTEKQIATAIAGSWQQLGVNAQVQVVSPSEHINVVYTSHTAPTMFLDGPQVVAPDYLWAYDGKCNNPFNDLLYCIPAADKLMAQYHTITNPAKRQQLLDKVQQLWVADSPRIPVYQPAFVAILNKQVTHYYYNLLGPDMRTWAKS